MSISFNQARSLMKAPSRKSHRDVRVTPRYTGYVQTTQEAANRRAAETLRTLQLEPLPINEALQDPSTPEFKHKVRTQK